MDKEIEKCLAMDEDEIKEKVEAVCRYWFSWKDNNSQSLYGGHSFSQDMVNMIKTCIKGGVEMISSFPIFICRNYEVGEEDGWEYEDKLEIPPTLGMHQVSRVDGVRLYPYITDYSTVCGGKRYISLGEDDEF